MTIFSEMFVSAIILVVQTHPHRHILPEVGGVRLEMRKRSVTLTFVCDMNTVIHTWK